MGVGVRQPEFHKRAIEAGVDIVLSFLNYTLLDQTLFISRGRTNPHVNQSTVECQGVKTTNGTIWLVDGVFMPQY